MSKLLNSVRFVGMLTSGFCTAVPMGAHAHGNALLPQSLPLVIAVLGGGGVCVSFTYDANGNRTAQVTAPVSTGATVWGSGTFGCFSWHQ